MEKIITVIVDDEPLACKRIAKLLKADEEIEIAAVCNNGKEAIQVINEQHPHIIFLDIQMPEVNGFEVLKQVELSLIPAFVFVTAFDEYALEAFEVHALDYLLKPFSEERFFDALKRAKYAVHQSSEKMLNEKINELLLNLNPSKGPLERLIVKSSGSFFFLNVEEIDWIESEGNYVNLHAGSKSYLIRDTMKNMESKLDESTFFRIHRSAIVNVNKIKKLEQWFHGDYKVIMENGKELTMSRNYKELLKQFS